MLRQEQAELVKMVFDAVYVDTKAKEIVAYEPKEPYRALFRLCQGLKEKNGLLVTSRYDHVAGIGDPEGARGRHSDSQPKDAGLIARDQSGFGLTKPLRSAGPSHIIPRILHAGKLGKFGSIVR